MWYVVVLVIVVGGLGGIVVFVWFVIVSYNYKIKLFI